MAGWNHKIPSLFCSCIIIIMSLSSFDISTLAVVQVKLLWQHKCSNACHNKTERESTESEGSQSHTHLLS